MDGAKNGYQATPNATLEQQVDTCPTCGSECNERDELTKAEREIERLRAEVASLTAQLQSGESFHAVAVRQRDAAWAEVEALRADAERLTGERDVAIGMLAYWCVAVDHNGTGWDDWDEHYKDAMYRPCLIRELLDSAIDAARTAQGLTKPK